MGGAAAGEHGGEDVEGEGEAGAFPKADGEGALGALDGGGIGGEVAGFVVAAGDGELLAAFAISGKGAVGELGHGNVEDDGSVWGRRPGAKAPLLWCSFSGLKATAPSGKTFKRSTGGDGEDEGVVAEGGSGGAPGWEVGEGVGPAEGGAAGFGSLPAIGSAALPVGGVAESYGSEAVGFG